MATLRTEAKGMRLMIPACGEGYSRGEGVHVWAQSFETAGDDKERENRVRSRPSQELF